MSKINFAIIGCGRIAKRHAFHIAKLGSLIALCDIKVERAQLLSEQYGGKVYSDIASLIAAHQGEIDVVSVCTPNGLHSQHSISLLKGGFNVLCEKPMATTTKDAGAMINTATQHNKHLFVVKQNRFNPPVKAVKKVIDDGLLGEIYSVQLNCFWNRNKSYYADSDWKGKKDLDGGTLFTQFSHFIDLLYWMIGDIKEVHSIIGNFAHQDLIEIEDNGVINMIFDNGAIGSIHYTVNSFDKNMEGSITIFAKNGTVKIGGQYLNELEYQQIKNYKITDLPKGNPPNNYGDYKGSMSNHDHVYQNIIDVLNNNAPIATTGREGYKTVEVIEKIYHAAKYLKYEK